MSRALCPCGHSSLTSEVHLPKPSNRLLPSHLLVPVAPAAQFLMCHPRDEEEKTRHEHDSNVRPVCTSDSVRCLAFCIVHLPSFFT